MAPRSREPAFGLLTTSMASSDSALLESLNLIASSPLTEFAVGLVVVSKSPNDNGPRFVPLLHPPGHAQVDFGEAIGEIGGKLSP